MRNMIAYRGPSVIFALGSHLFGRWWMNKEERGVQARR